MTLGRMIGWTVAACALALSAAQAQPPESTPTPPPAPVMSTGDIDTAVSLLDRIDRIVTNARKDPNENVHNLEAVGTSGKSGGSAMVKMDAADLDEIHAEVEQLKRLLKPGGDALKTR